MNIEKCDAALGQRVEAMLRSKGLHTPTVSNALTLDDKVDAISEHFRAIMDTLGLDLRDDSLQDTPRRVAKMFVKETMWGLNPDLFPKMMLIDNKMDYDEMLVSKDISVMSLCEHHFVTIRGVCHIAYMPNAAVVGLSKFNRVVDYFSRRPQVQERLTSQIFETLKFLLDTEDVAVVIEADHFCVISRGVRDQNSSTVTSAMGGIFRKPEVRAEFLSLVRK